MLNTFTVGNYILKTMFHLSQLQSSLLLLCIILLYHMLMLIILLYYTAILKEIILFVN